MNSYQNKNKKISINNVSKSYDGIKILDNISIDVYEGEFVSILGPSGCGKSTLFNLICNLTQVDNGEINVNGKISYMYQKDLLLPYKTIIDNVSLPLILNKQSKKESRKIVSPYLEKFGLGGYENKYPNELSGGMKQRANFLRTYINSNDIMLLDEPFGALDSITRLSMQKWLLEVKSKVNSTIFLITHDIDEAIMLSNRIYLISQKPASIKKEFIINKNNNNLDEVIKLKNEILSLL